MQKHRLLIIILTCTSLASAQDAAQPRSSNDGALGTSATYSDTLRRIRKWAGSEETDDLAQLLMIGERRKADFVEACRSSEDEIASVAFLTLQLLGNASCGDCADSISQKHGELVTACSSSVTEQDFERIEMWLAKKRTVTGYDCAENDDTPNPIDDSAVYALILDGSGRSRSLLEGMLAFEKACDMESTIVGEVLQEVPSLIAATKLAHDLDVKADKLEKSVRASAFFLPKEYRNDAKVEAIFRDEARGLILLEVSYRCGNLCGKGYYVVVRNDGGDWHYTAIRMAWIS